MYLYGLSRGESDSAIGEVRYAIHNFALSPRFGSFVLQRDVAVELNPQSLQLGIFGISNYNL